MCFPSLLVTIGRYYFQLQINIIKFDFVHATQLALGTENVKVTREADTIMVDSVKMVKKYSFSGQLLEYNWNFLYVL